VVCGWFRVQTHPAGSAIVILCIPVLDDIDRLSDVSSLWISRFSKIHDCLWLASFQLPTTTPKIR
jgi:hypothetical protein